MWARAVLRDIFGEFETKEIFLHSVLADIQLQSLRSSCTEGSAPLSPSSSSHNTWETVAPEDVTLLLVASRAFTAAKDLSGHDTAHSFWDFTLLFSAVDNHLV